MVIEKHPIIYGQANSSGFPGWGTVRCCEGGWLILWQSTLAENITQTTMIELFGAIQYKTIKLIDQGVALTTPTPPWID